MTENEFENEFEKLKELNVVMVKNFKTYHFSNIVSLLLLNIVLVVTFIYFVLPLHQFILTGGFIGGILAGFYNVIMEIVFPEKHLHWVCKVPENYEGWKILYMISKCIQYKPAENIVTLQFMDEIEPQLEEILYDIMENGVK